MNQIVLCDSAEACHEHYRNIGEPTRGITKGSVCWQCGYSPTDLNFRHLHVINRYGDWEGVCSEGCAITATQKGIV